MRDITFGGDRLYAGIIGKGIIRNNFKIGRKGNGFKTVAEKLRV